MPIFRPNGREPAVAGGSYLKGRASLSGRGPAPVEVLRGTHTFNDWPVSTVDQIVDYIRRGSPE